MTRFCVIEMGARHVGDIARLCAIAKPHIGIVLVVGNAHLGEFGSPEGIARAKSELIDSLSPHGVAILGTYDPYTPHMGEGVIVSELLLASEAIVMFGLPILNFEKALLTLILLVHLAAHQFRCVC